MADNSKPALLLPGVTLVPKEGITHVSPSLRVCKQMTCPALVEGE